jgi:hypothetical protein
MHKVYFVLLALYFFCPYSGLAQSEYSTNHARFSKVQAGMKDRHLEAEAVWVVNRKAASIRCREEYKKAVIVSDDWELERNEQGFITGRHLHMELYGETEDGRCGMAHCILRQKVEGDNTYSPKLRLADMGEFYALECE